MERLPSSRSGEVCYFHRLENGLSLYILPRPGASSQYAALAVGCGGLYRRFSSAAGPGELTPGVPDLLRRRLASLREGRPFRALAELGAQPGSFTAPDLTVYRLSCTQSFPSALRTLLRAVTRQDLSQVRALPEREEALRSLARAAGDPETAARQNLLRGLYRDHPIRDADAPSPETVRQIAAPALARCYGTFYDPGNLALCVVGDVDPRQMAALARAVLPPSGAPPVRACLPEEGADAAQPALCAEVEEVPPRFALGWKAEGSGEGPEGLRRRLTGRLAAALLAGESSPLRGRLEEDALAAASLRARYRAYPGAAFLALTGESRDPETLCARAREEGEALAERIDPERFARVRRAVYGRLVRALEDPEAAALWMLRGSFGGYPAFAWEECFREITAEEVRDFLRRTIREAGRTCSTVRPKGGTI